MLYIIVSNKYELSQEIFSEIKHKNVKLLYIPELNKYRSFMHKVIYNVLSFFKIYPSCNFSKDTMQLLQDINFEDTLLFWDVTSYLLLLSIIKLKRTKRTILWCWNTLTINDNFIKERAFANVLQQIEVYTFDKADAQKYGLKYKQQLCYDITKFSNLSFDQKVDFYFVGYDKNRLKILIRFYEQVKKYGYKCKFNVLKDNTTRIEIPNYFSQSSVSFIENIKNINSSEAVLEIVKNGQTGLTVRALEAILAGKKLITNNGKIIDYFEKMPKNIFIFTDGKIDELRTFMDSDTESFYINRDSYLINNWLEEFM